MNELVNNVIKNVVLANEDGEVQALAVVLVNTEGEPELHLGMPHGHAYKILAALEILKYNIIKQILDDAGRPLKDRE